MSAWKSLEDIDASIGSADEIGPAKSIPAILGSGGAELTGPDGIGAAIPIDFGTKVELRDGSLKWPIKLPRVLRKNGGTVRRLMTIMDDGTLQSWAPKSGSARKVLVYEAGEIFFDTNEGSVKFAAGTINSGTTPRALVGVATVTEPDGSTSDKLVEYEGAALLDALEFELCGSDGTCEC